jgi:chemotaxis protein histidine kinase CheA
MRFLSLLYERVFYTPRKHLNIIAPFWKAIDTQIMLQLKSDILESSDDEPPDSKTLAENIKNKVIEELENKQKQEDDKAEYERKERHRLKKIQKRKRAKERQHAEQLAEQKAKQIAEQKAEQLAEQKEEEKDNLKIDEDINKIQEYINNLQEAKNIRDEANGVKRPEKFDYSKCPCGSKTYRKDLHEKTQRHKNYIESGTVHKTKTQTERNIKRYHKNSQIIKRCECGEDVKESSKAQHEQSKKHIYFIEHGHKQPAGNYMIRCECGTYFLKYNMARHKNTIGHRHYLESL